MQYLFRALRKPTSIKSRPKARALSTNSEPFSLPPLPWARKSLAPSISEETIEYHYDKHHRTYVNKLNAIVAGKPEAQLTLEEIINKSQVNTPIYNNAAQIWNHTFYWNCMSPEGGGKPKGRIAEQIESHFGSWDNFKKEFNSAATNHFGSGWAWLVKEKDNKLKIFQGHDAINPLTYGLRPILTCDVWEHAYYIDFRNDRSKYVEKWWEVVNWEFANKNLGDNSE
eukprot:TRINITY_DN424_c0_g3_i1.p1 TRINITY_DN424_c0_g3~~TRINITY_DN424_c0_g3_i1.p1  ORF type:complete len:226 (+),score=35.84 TRINITY_DN424_c0_g3_i1:44-721(+)